MTLTTTEAQEACKIASDKWAARCARAESALARREALIAKLRALMDEGLDALDRLRERDVLDNTTEK